MIIVNLKSHFVVKISQTPLGKSNLARLEGVTLAYKKKRLLHKNS